MTSNQPLTQKEKYEKLAQYYDNDPYDDDPSVPWTEQVKSLRTVVNRSVEFYVSKVLPDTSAIKITASTPNIVDPIRRVWTWSNFAAQKNLAVRHLSLYGNLFWKVVADDEKVYFEVIEPKNVTDFKEDTRGYVTEIRLDIPIVVEGRNKMYTEFWSKTENYFAVWVHEFGEDTPLDQLGDPQEFSWLEELGIDFVPIVHVKARDTGDKYGKGCVEHVLGKIDEANREATRLSEMLFRFGKATMVVSANASDKNGRPMPAPRLEDADVVQGDILRLPGMAGVESLVPNINYDSALHILNAMMEELENDLPELRYYSMRDTQLSGKAVRSILAAAIDRATEYRGNIIQGLVRANQIALTLGSFWGLFPGIGTYERGDYDHDIETPEMFGTSLDEKATILKELTSAGMPLASAMLFVGYSQEEVDETMTAKQTEDRMKEDARNQSLANTLTTFNRG